MIHGLRDANSNDSKAYCEIIPSEVIAPQSSSIVAVPAIYMELRALSIVAWIVCQLSCGVSAAAPPSDSCIARLPSL